MVLRQWIFLHVIKRIRWSDEIALIIRDFADFADTRNPCAPTVHEKRICELADGSIVYSLGDIMYKVNNSGEHHLSQSEYAYAAEIPSKESY